MVRAPRQIEVFRLPTMLNLEEALEFILVLFYLPIHVLVLGSGWGGLSCCLGLLYGALPNQDRKKTWLLKRNINTMAHEECCIHQHYGDSMWTSTKTGKKELGCRIWFFWTITPFFPFVCFPFAVLRCVCKFIGRPLWCPLKMPTFTSFFLWFSRVQEEKCWEEGRSIKGQRTEKEEEWWRIFTGKRWW